MTIREEVNEMIEIFVKEYGTNEVRTEKYIILSEINMKNKRNI